MDERIFILHHGTIKKFSDLILIEKKFVMNSRKDHWLGNGIYFFVDDLEQAFIWAKLCKRRAIKKQKELSLEQATLTVLEHTFSVDKLDNLNLDSRSDRMKLDHFIKELAKMEIRIECNDEHENMCLLMDLYVRYYNIKASKYTFTGNANLKRLSTVKIENHGEQFCIYDNGSIDFDTICIKEREG